MAGGQRPQSANHVTARGSNGGKAYSATQRAVSKLRPAANVPPRLAKGAVKAAAPTGKPATRLPDSRPARAMAKGVDRTTDAARYQTDQGEMRLHFNGTATMGSKRYAILGKASDTSYILQDPAGALFAFSHRSETHGDVASYALGQHEYIASGKLFRVEGNRIRRTPYLSGSAAVPDAGFIAPDGTRILRTKALAQPGAPSEVAFVQGEGGAYVARLVWHTDGDLKPLAAPSISLLGADGIEYRAKQAPYEVFVSDGGDVLQYRQGKIARPPPSTNLSKSELTWADGSYAVTKRLDAKQAGSPTIVTNHLGMPLGRVIVSPGGNTVRALTDDDFLPEGGLAKAPGTIETAAKITMADKSTRPVAAVAVRLATGSVARGIVVERTPDAMVLETADANVHIMLLKRADGWHPGSTQDRFVDGEGMAWRVTTIGAKVADDAPTHVLGRSTVSANKVPRAAVFLRTKVGDNWVFTPAPEARAQSIHGTSSLYIAGTESYRIVSKPADVKRAAAAVVTRMETVGPREAPKGPVNKVPSAPLRKPYVAANPSVEEFPFAIGIKSTAAATPTTIRGWGSLASGDLLDYHPADLAFFHVEPSGTLKPATVGELRAFFESTLGRQKPLVNFTDLARPEALEIVQSVDEIAWDAALVAKAKQAVGALRLRPTDKLVIAYDACGNVAARPLHTENAREGHPTLPQWRDWLTELPLLTLLQSDAFGHSNKKNNGSWGRHEVEGPQTTMMGYSPGGYNKYGGLRRLAHESLGHGTERLLPLMQTLLALTAYLDAAEGTNFMERNYQTGPWEQHTTNLEAYMADSAKYFKEHPHHAQLLMAVLQADKPVPQAFDNFGLYTMLRTAMGLAPEPTS